MNPRRTLVLLRKELKSFFYSPIAYIVMVIYLIVGGVLFWTAFFVQNQAEMRNYFQMLPWILTFIIPAMTMRLFAEEKKTGSYELLVTMPVTLNEIIIAKFLSALVFIALTLGFIFVYALSVELVGDLDWGPVWGGWFGALLLSSFYISIGLFSSSLARNQITAFLIGLFVCVFFFLVDKFFVFLPTEMVEVFNYFSSDKHFKKLAKGMIDSRDVLFFVLFTIGFMLLTREKLNAEFVGQNNRMGENNKPINKN